MTTKPQETETRATSGRRICLWSGIGLVLTVLCHWLADSVVAAHCVRLQEALRAEAGLVTLASKGPTVVIMLIAAFYVLFGGQRRQALVKDLLFMGFLAFVSSQTLHLVIPRIRPFMALAADPLVGHFADYSFPSDHVTMGVAVAVFIFMRMNRTLGAVAFGLVLVTGVTRVLVLLHWPSDVLGGVVLGATAVTGLGYLQVRLGAKFGIYGWQAFFERDECIEWILMASRLTAAAGLFIRFSPWRQNLLTNPEPPLPAVDAQLIWAVAIAFLAYVGVTNLLLYRGARTRIRHEEPRRHFLLKATLWGDSGFFALCYALTGSLQSYLFLFLLIPIVATALFMEFEFTITSLMVSLASLALGIFLIYEFGRGGSEIQHDLFPKQRLTLFIFLPRAFILTIACIPIAWLIERQMKIEKERATYESLVECIPQYILRKNRKGVVTYANRAFCELNKLTKEQIIGKTDRFLYNRRMARSYREGDQEVIKSRKTEPIDERHFPFQQKNFINVEGYKIPVTNKHGKVIEVQSIFWNVTDRKERESQLMALMQASSDRIYFKDQDSKFTKVSNTQARLFGFKNPQRLVGKSDADFFTEEHAAQALEDERKLMVTGEPFKDRVERETWPDGRVTWALTTKQCRLDEEGKVVGTFGISRDITDQKNREDMLEKDNNDLMEKLEKASSIAGLGFWEYIPGENGRFLGENGRYDIEFSDESHNILGIRRGFGIAELGKIRTTVHCEDQHIWDDCFVSMENAQPFDARVIRMMFDGGREKHLEIRGLPAELDAAGKTRSVMGLVQDVSERVRSQERQRAIEWVIEGFRHMVPGKAGEVESCLNLAGPYIPFEEARVKALIFLFMIIHKSNEVKTLMLDEPHFRPYTLGEVWDNAWPMAGDMRFAGRRDLQVEYAGGAGDHTQVKGAFYTAALNFLANARTYGSGPFVVWVHRDGMRLVALFGDGGPNEFKPVDKKGGGGVGLLLSRKMLEISGGHFWEDPKRKLAEMNVGFPAALLGCPTLYGMEISLN